MWKLGWLLMFRLSCSESAQVPCTEYWRHQYWRKKFSSTDPLSICPIQLYASLNWTLNWTSLKGMQKTIHPNCVEYTLIVDCPLTISAITQQSVVMYVSTVTVCFDNFSWRFHTSQQWQRRFRDNIGSRSPSRWRVDCNLQCVAAVLQVVTGHCCSASCYRTCITTSHNISCCQLTRPCSTRFVKHFPSGASSRVDTLMSRACLSIVRECETSR